MRLWIKQRDKLIHPYSLVGYLHLPNPTIMVHAYNNRSDIHNNAVVKLITKLIVNPMLVGDDRSCCLVDSCPFWDEYGCFVNKQKMFCMPHMWELSARDDKVQRADGIRDILFIRQRFLVGGIPCFV
jgi:hypothetical protein